MLSRYTVIDAHAHLWPSPSFSLKTFIGKADKLGIDRLCVSMLPRGTRPSRPEEFRKANEAVFKAMREYPGRILGYCFVNPCYEKEALRELRRCLEEYGMLGLKLYTDCHCLDPRVSRLVEIASEHEAPVLVHMVHVSRRWFDTLSVFHRNPITATTPDELCVLARRHPRATFIAAHIGGGGHWEIGIKALKNCGNVLLDTGGSGVDLGMIEMAARELGVERLVFGTDNFFCTGIAKIKSAEMDLGEKEAILGGNMLRLIEKRGIP